MNFKLGKVHSNPYARAFKPQQVVEVDGDHEVKMASGQLDYIIKSATELKDKLGDIEKNIPAWIQDHISKSHSYIHQANSGYHELGETKKSMKLTSLLSLNEDANMNKKVKALLDKELRGLPEGRPEHQFAVMHTLIGALRDANFHSELKKVPPIFPKADYLGDSTKEKDTIDLYEDEIGPKVANICGYDGGEIVDAIGFYVSMTIGRPVGEKIQKLVEVMKKSVNENTKRVKLLGIEFNVSEMNGRLFFSFVDKKAATIQLRQVGTNKIVNHIQTRLDIAYGKGTFFFKSGDRAEFQNGYLFQRNAADINLNKLKSEVVKENTEPQIITQLRDVMKSGYKKLKDPKTGRTMTVDSYSASAIVKVYDALKNPKNKEKFSSTGLLGMQNMAFKLIK